MVVDTLVTPEIRAWIGKTAPPLSGEPILARDIKRYALAIGDPDPIYFDEVAARAAGHRAIPAPVGYLYWAAHPWCRTIPEDELRADGTPDTADPLRPPLPTSKVVRGGDDYEFFGRVYAGDTITLHRRITDIFEKQGRSGVMVFVQEEYTYMNDEDTLVARQIITRIYRA